jgi:hypothetical protein
VPPVHPLRTSGTARHEFHVTKRCSALQIQFWLHTQDAKVFKKYSQMKLQMKREALTRLNRQAGDAAARKSFDTEDEDE